MTSEPTGNKICKGCRETKPPSEFYRKSSTRWEPICQTCKKSRRKSKENKKLYAGNESSQHLDASQKCTEEEIDTKFKYCSGFKFPMRFDDFPDGRVVIIETPEEWERLVGTVALFEQWRADLVGGKAPNMTHTNVKALRTKLRREERKKVLPP